MRINAKAQPTTPEQFRKKCATVFRPELRNKEPERFRVSVKDAPDIKPRCIW
jgi:hypothetical protein